MNRPAFSEVIESSLHQWKTHCWEWSNFPDAGSLVVIDEDDRQLFGIVHAIETGSIDPTRSPFPYQKTEAELKRDHPEVFSFLKTTCTCVCAGFREKNNAMLYHQPSRPPRIHAFTRQASRHEEEIFFATDDYLMLLTRYLSPEQLDDLLFALINKQKTSFVEPCERIFDFFETYAHLVNHDYLRLRSLAARIEKIVPNLIPTRKT